MRNLTHVAATGTRARPVCLAFLGAVLCCGSSQVVSAAGPPTVTGKGFPPGFELVSRTPWKTPNRGRVRGFATDGEFYYVGDYALARILKYDRQGNLVDEIGKNGPRYDMLGHGVTTDGTSVWSSDYSGRRIHQFDITANREAASWEIPMKGNPTSLAYADGKLVVTTYGRKFLHLVSLDGKLLDTFPIFGQWGIPIAFDGRDRVYESVAHEQRFRIYSLTTRKAVGVIYDFPASGSCAVSATNEGFRLCQLNRDGHLEEYAFRAADYAASRKALEASAKWKDSGIEVKPLPNRQPAVAINANGNLTLDGEPFFPIGIYSCICAGDLYEHATGDDLTPTRYREWFATIRKSGFNVVQSYAQPWTLKKLYPHVGCPNGCHAFLDYAKEAGLYGMAEFCHHGLGSKLPWETLKQDITGTVETLVDHPALLLWYLADEPHGEAALTDMKRRYRLVKSLDPVHPLFSVHYDEHALRTLGDRTDILAEDCYPIGGAYGSGKWYPPAACADWQDLIIGGQKGGKPYAWSVPQIHRRPGVNITRKPTPAEVRLMTWLRLTKDVKGLFYFTFSKLAVAPYSESPPAYWNDVSEIVRSINSVLPAMFSSEKTSDYRVSDGRVYSMMKKVTRDGRDHYYLLAANPTCEDREASLEDHPIALGEVTFSNIPASPGDVVTVLDENSQGDFELGSTRTIALERTENGRYRFGDDFAPFAAHSYRIGPPHP